MAQERIEIKFTPKGHPALIKAVKELNKATTRLNGQLGRLGKVNVNVAKTQDLVTQRVNANTVAVNANSTAFTRLQSTISVYRNKMLLAGFATGLLVRPMIDVVSQAGRFEDLERGFDGLAQSIESTPEFLNKLREATNGTVDDMDLMQQANNAMMLGIVQSEDEMAKLFDTAQRLGKALGRDTVSSIESLVTGMGRQSRLMLDNLGIIVKSEEAYEAFATANNTTASALTDSEKKIAFNIEAMDQAASIVEKLGIEHLSTTDHIAALQVGTARLGRELGLILAPVVIAMSRGMSDLASVIENNRTLFKAFIITISALSVGFVALKLATSQSLKMFIVKTAAIAVFSATTVTATGTTISFTGAIKNLTIAMMKNPYIAAAAGIVALTGAVFAYLKLTEDTDKKQDEFNNTVVKANNVNEDYEQSVQQNVNTLQQELDLLNADNDLQRMAIKLKRDLTKENDGLHQSEIDLFNQLQARKKELEEIKKQEKEELERKQKIQDIIEDAAMFGKDRTLETLKEKQSLIEAEIQHAEAIIARAMMEGDSIEEGERLGAQLDKLKQTYINIDDEIARYIEKNREKTDEEKKSEAAQKTLTGAYEGTLKAQRDLLKSEIDLIEKTADLSDPKVQIGLKEMKSNLKDIDKQIKEESNPLFTLYKERLKEAFVDSNDEILKRNQATLNNIRKMPQAMKDNIPQFEASFAALEAEFQAFADKIADEELQDKLKNITGFLPENTAETLETLSGFLDEQIQLVQASAEARMKVFDDEANAEIAAKKKSRGFNRLSASQQEKELAKIREDAEKKKKKERDKANKAMAVQFRLNQMLAVNETLMNTSRGAMLAIGQTGIFGFSQAAIIKAMGAVEIATILAQKPPKMEQGGLVGGRRHSQGGTLIEAEQGEFVMNRNAVDAIGVENLNRMNMGGGSPVSISFSGNVMSDDFIENEAIPKIKEAVRRGSDIGVS